MPETQYNPHHRPEPHLSEFNRPVVEEFRANAGRVGGPFAGGDLLLLTTVGAKSGREHTTPLAYVRIEGRLLVVASAGGSPRNPDWYHNILAHPMARVELGDEAFGAVAVPVEGAERDRLFDLVVRAVPGFGDYQATVQRRLPVVALERQFADTPPWKLSSLGDKLVEVHTWLREQLRHVRAEVDAHFAARDAADPAPAGLGLQIRQHCLAFCESLEFHHTSEDNAVLPDLERRYPELSGVIGRLRAEHRTVARIRGELETHLANLPGADPASFRAELDRMATELEVHLDYEEQQLIPVFARIPLPGS
ncbi:nitroreductase/quinone reductase family protein [Prauserella muralis]|uniref:Cation-binding protein n=1 Tax=Prauserella muralis TaxID=588067 RepID=A0A2V4AQ24_9PSEU|nr:nitroreductase/quinone reductase family protein [Prauserella muralis]PXY22588.1 cation-binding protein [Prauserella muralis]TWE28285.1 deazaflavin-dependent oxidoreductase (nitroreductase family) [Prauserella muralis]